MSQQLANQKLEKLVQKVKAFFVLTNQSVEIMEDGLFFTLKNKDFNVYIDEFFEDDDRLFLSLFKDKELLLSFQGTSSDTLAALKNAIKFAKENY